MSQYILQKELLFHIVYMSIYSNSVSPSKSLSTDKRFYIPTYHVPPKFSLIMPRLAYGKSVILIIEQAITQNTTIISTSLL